MELTINGKSYGLQWGLGAIEIYCDIMNCDIEGLDLAITSNRTVERGRAINTLTLAAIQNWCELHSVEFDLSYRAFQAWLTDQPQETANQIIENWKASKYFGKTVAEYYFGDIPVNETETVKKNSPSEK